MGNICCDNRNRKTEHKMCINCKIRPLYPIIEEYCIDCYLMTITNITLSLLVYLTNIIN